MKIRRSLKIFFMCATMGMATVTVVSFSMLAASYFEKGLDSGVRMTMREIGYYADSHFSEPQNVLGFNVAYRWQDVPSKIRTTLKQPSKHLEFLKKLDRDYWFSEPNRAFFLLRYDEGPNNVVYISRFVGDKEALELNRQLNTDELPRICKILGYAALGLIGFALCMYFLMQLVAKPIEQLALWAKNLTPCQFSSCRPDFQYNELNRLADMVKTSLSSVEDTLRREQKFLAHASHELRTPIAVVRSNTELMIKLVEKPDTVEKQKQVLERILRAGVTMTDLCETLLWLNRGEDSELPFKHIKLGELIEQLCRELNYLLRDKEVEVNISVDEGGFLLPATLCRIVLSNIIRNAYQHTLRGRVTIEQVGSQVSIINVDESGGDTQDQLGFGLGLELTNRILRHYHWAYTIEEYPQGRDVLINFIQQ